MHEVHLHGKKTSISLLGKLSCKFNPLGIHEIQKEKNDRCMLLGKWNKAKTLNFRLLLCLILKKGKSILLSVCFFFEIDKMYNNVFSKITINLIHITRNKTKNNILVHTCGVCRRGTTRSNFKNNNLHFALVGHVRCNIN